MRLKDIIPARHGKDVNDTLWSTQWINFPNGIVIGFMMSWLRYGQVTPMNKSTQ